MKTDWKNIWENLRLFSAGRNFEYDYRWIKNEIKTAIGEAA
nr:hypothetical protein [Enterobacter sp.]